MYVCIECRMHVSKNLIQAPIQRQLPRLKPTNSTERETARSEGCLPVD